MKPVFRNPFENGATAQSVRARQSEASCATITVSPSDGGGGPTPPEDGGGGPATPPPGGGGDGLIPGVSDTLALGGGAALVLLLVVVLVAT